MVHLPHLISDLALILGAAAVVTLLFKWLKQPLVLGYIIAGFLVGPYFTLFPTVYEAENIRIWAEIGVIFLLFSLGLEFSFKKLIKVGGSASVTAIVEVIVMVLLGYGVGKIMGWSNMDSLFLGGILSISSTTIIIRAFDELGLKTKKFASLVFGVLIVEDLVAIVLLVLLSTLGVSQQFAGTEMLMSIAKLIFFLAIWFLSGIFFIPTFLRKAKKIMNDEMLLLVSIALCLLMVVFANQVGFSPALGAFIMGSILAETTKAEKIEHLIKPVKDLFGAIFFVSVGMMIDPQVIAQYAIPIFVLCIVTIVGKVASTSLGALLSGQPLQTSIQAGFSLAQIGEFSFIIATLGLTLKVTSPFLYPIAVAVSAVTTLTTPYLIKSSGAFYQWLVKILPPDLVKNINRYSTETKQVSQTSDWKVFVRSAVLNVILLSIIILSVIVFSSLYVQPWIDDNEGSLFVKIMAVVLTLFILLPFLWALAIKSPVEVNRVVIRDAKYRNLLFTIRILKLVLTALFIGFLLDRYFNIYVGIGISVLMIVLLLIFSENIQKFYGVIEKRFFSNLNQREISEAKTNRSELAPWDAYLVPVNIEPWSSCAGKTLLDLQWRERIGINVVLIKRGGLNIPAPGKEQVIFPGDQLLVLGTDMQIQKLRASIRSQVTTDEVSERADVELHKILVREQSYFNGKTIRQTGFRENAASLVVGIERANERILNPESDFVLLPNDVVFVVGNRKMLEKLKHSKINPT